MFQTQESKPWYQSLPGLIVASVLLPPVGIVLLWMRRSSPIFVKALATVAILVLGAGYVFLFTAWRRSAQNEAHYTELEQHRAQQQSLVAQQPLASQAQASPGQAQAAASPGAEAAFAQATKYYWTNYRGRNRCGRFVELLGLN